MREPKNTSVLPILFYLICSLIIYGSMYPFEFSSTVSPELMQDFLRSWRQKSGRGDILGNIALFVPFGYLGYLYLGNGRRLFQVLLPLGVIGFTLAMACQLVQLYIPARSPSLFDVYGNGLGFLLGFALAFRSGDRQLIAWRSNDLFKNFALLLIGSWMSARLLPFVPTIDWQSYKDAVKPLLHTPQFVWSEFLLMSVSWLVVAWMGKSILADRWRTVYLPISIVLVLGLEIVVVNNTVSLSDVCAGAMAVLMWRVVSRQNQRPGSGLPWLLLLTYALSTLFPFVMTAGPSTFHWLPFAGFLEGSMLINSTALCEKVFVFGAIFWLLNQMRSLSFPKIAVVTVIVLMTEIAQLWRLGSTPELTDPLLVLFIGYLILRLREGDRSALSRADGVTAAMSPRSSSQNESGSGERRIGVGSQEPNGGSSPGKVQVQDPDPAVAMGVQILRESGVLASPVSVDPFVVGSSGSRTGQRKKVLWLGGGASLLIMVTAFVVLRLPGVPYNLRELFLFGGNGIDLFFFSLALLSFGGCSAWVGQRLAVSRKAVIAGPLAAMAASVVVYVLLIVSVTRESIMDVSGSSVVVHRVGSRGVLGQPGIDFVAMVGADNLRVLTDFFEPVIRFGALIGPLIIFLGVILAIHFYRARISASSSPLRITSIIGRLFFYLLLMLPWLYFCKVIAFDWSSTDNLNELIAPDGYFGWGGGGYLYALVALMTVCAGFLARSGEGKRSTVLKALAVTVLSLPLAWWLLNMGLDANVNKYGLEFSGVDFLLGPDRAHLLTELELFWRWAFLYLCMVGGLAFGAGLYLRWVRDSAGLYATKGFAQQVDKTRAINGDQTIALVVRLHQHQLDYLSRLAEQLNTSVPLAVGHIINCLGREIRLSSSVKTYIHYQLDRNVGEIPEGSMMRSCDFDLSESLMAVVGELQQQKDISSSRVVRKLVDSFMLMSQESLSTPS